MTIIMPVPVSLAAAAASESASEGTEPQAIQIHWTVAQSDQGRTAACSRQGPATQ